ncbi:hypothetical protein ACQP2E_19855 [Actinoplanes sp. CA-015351]|uniref:hypothetical protein n=1 Tax=Actinoplanes sp. CA-015351 TaxID=3239897 RepID=UPI003D97E0F8
MDAVGRAEEFLQVNGRLLDRVRFDFHFRGGSAGRVIDALRPYQNADGGFGHALEPDLRGPESQPVPVEVALQVMDGLGALDGGLLGGGLLGGSLKYLASITRPDGGVPWVLPTTSPHGPWWVPAGGLPGSLNPTASIAGLLLKHGVSHPWVTSATEFCWAALDDLTTPDAFDVLCILRFLENVPDRQRASAAWSPLSRFVTSIAELDPHAEGYVHGPLDFAPLPGSLARSMFPADVISQHLDALAANQKEDGGWDFAFPAWTPITRFEWRGWVTVEALLTLHTNGRLR